MPVYERHTHLPHPRPEVFDWFTRPGALVRLSPPFSGSVRQEPTDGIEPGSTAVLGIGAPGSLGLGLGSATGFVAGQLPFRRPDWAAPELPWRARHTELVPGEMFQDVMESGPLAAWTHTHLFEDAGVSAGTPGHVQPEATGMTDRIEYELPGGGLLQKASGALPGPLGKLGRVPEKVFGAELGRIFAYRERQLLGDLAFHAQHAGSVTGGEARTLTVAVSGASGLIGTQLCALLAGGGHTVLRLVRGESGGAGAEGRDDVIVWDPATGSLDADALTRADVVVNLAGESIGGRYTPERKREILDSRVDGTALLARALADLAADGRQRTLVNGSAVGYYGAHASDQDQWLGEDAPAGEDFLAQVCRDWEDATALAQAAGVRTVLVRTGIVQSPAGGMLQQMLPLFVTGAGGPLGVAGGRDPWISWIGIDDVAGIFAHTVLDGELEGPVNAVAPEPVRASEFARVLGQVLHRPSVIPVPGFGPRALLGTEGAQLMVEASQRASAARVEGSGYVFRTPDLESTLRHVLGR